MDKLLRENFVYFKHDYIEGEVIELKETIKLDKKVKSLKFYGTSLGMYEVLLNKNKIDEQYLKPGFTYYNKRLLFQEIDLTDKLEKENILEILLGQGWYSGRFFCENTTKNFGNDTAISYVIEIIYEDGLVEYIKSREDMDVYNTLYEYAGIYDGEVINESIPIKIIGKTSKYELKSDILLEKTITKVCKNEEVPTNKVTTYDDYFIIDFGQNFAGKIELNLSLVPNNSDITIYHGELLNSDNKVYRNNLRKAKACIKYHKVNSSSYYEPFFTYMGFRYIEVHGVKYVDGLITANAVYTKMDQLGTFSCDNKKVERLYLNQLWSMRSNYVEVPTDCPQRDERLGYTGDAQVFISTAVYNYDVRNFFYNFFKDLRLLQLDTPDRNISPYCPDKTGHPVGFMSMQGWGSAVSIIPSILKKNYNDLTLITDYYDAIKDYVDLEISKSKHNLWCAISLGDWLSLGKGVAWQAMNNHPVSNAFFVNDLRVLRDAAKLLSKEEDYLKYSEQYKKTHDAYIKKFIKKNGLMVKDYQGSYSVCLAYVLEDSDEIKNKVYEKFLENVRRNGLSTGFFGTANLLPLICDKNPHLAYDILLSENCPGWMYEINHGATTIWERWDAIKEDGIVNESKMSKDNMVSFNHYSFGAVGRFYYEYILGIKPLKDGFNEAIIRPYPDERLNKVSGSYKTCNGAIYSSWEYTDKTIEFKIDTPVKSIIILPDNTKYEVLPGIYEYSIKKN